MFGYPHAANNKNLYKIREYMDSLEKRFQEFKGDKSDVQTCIQLLNQLIKAQESFYEFNLTELQRCNADLTSLKKILNSMMDAGIAPEIILLAKKIINIIEPDLIHKMRITELDALQGKLLTPVLPTLAVTFNTLAKEINTFLKNAADALQEDVKNEKDRLDTREAIRHELLELEQDEQKRGNVLTKELQDEMRMTIQRGNPPSRLQSQLIEAQQDLLRCAQTLNETKQHPETLPNFIELRLKFVDILALLNRNSKNSAKVFDEFQAQLIKLFSIPDIQSNVIDFGLRLETKGDDNSVLIDGNIFNVYDFGNFLNSLKNNTDKNIKTYLALIEVLWQKLEDIDAILGSDDGMETEIDRALEKLFEKVSILIQMLDKGNIHKLIQINEAQQFNRFLKQVYQKINYIFEYLVIQSSTYEQFERSEVGNRLISIVNKKGFITSLFDNLINDPHLEQEYKKIISTNRNVLMRANPSLMLALMTPFQSTDSSGKFVEQADQQFKKILQSFDILITHFLQHKSFSHLMSPNVAGNEFYQTLEKTVVPGGVAKIDKVAEDKKLNKKS